VSAKEPAGPAPHPIIPSRVARGAPAVLTRRPAPLYNSLGVEPQRRDTVTPRIVARAPVRILDLGGWTDTRILPAGRVFNLAVRLYTYVAIDFIPEGDGFEIVGRDVEESEYVRSVRAMEYGGSLALVKAAIRRTGISGGLRILVRSEAPPASGLGSSASLGVAAVGALTWRSRRYLLPYAAARLAQALETEELDLECGVQDQLAAAYGGVNYIEVRYPEASVHPVPVTDRFLCELESRLVLVYTGKSRFSSDTHRKVIEGHASGVPGVRAAFDGLLETAPAALDAVLREDFRALADAVNRNWGHQKSLHPSITTPEVDALEQAAFANGAIAFKLNGAGSGGTAVVLCDRDRQPDVERAVRQGFPGMRILPAKLDVGRCQGLQVWSCD